MSSNSVEKIYNNINEIVSNHFPNDPGKIECIVSEFRKKQVGENHTHPDYQNDPDKLAKIIQPFINEAEKNCENSDNNDSPSNIIIPVVSVIGIIVLGVVIFFITKCMRKQHKRQRIPNNPQF